MLKTLFLKPQVGFYFFTGYTLGFLTSVHKLFFLMDWANFRRYFLRILVVNYRYYLLSTLNLVLMQTALKIATFHSSKFEYFYNCSPLFYLIIRTVLAIAGEDYALIATDTRLSQGFSIHSRDCPKTYTL